MKTLLVSFMAVGIMFGQAAAVKPKLPTVEEAKAQKAEVDALPVQIDGADKNTIKDLQIRELQDALGLKQLEDQYKKVSEDLQGAQKAEVELQPKLIEKYHAKGYHLTKDLTWEKDPEVKK